MYIGHKLYIPYVFTSDTKNIHAHHALYHCRKNNIQMYNFFDQTPQLQFFFAARSVRLLSQGSYYSRAAFILLESQETSMTDKVRTSETVTAARRCQ